MPGRRGSRCPRYNTRSVGVLTPMLHLVARAEDTCRGTLAVGFCLATVRSLRALAAIVSGLQDQTSHGPTGGPHVGGWPSWQSAIASHHSTPSQKRWSSQSASSGEPTHRSTARSQASMVQPLHRHTAGPDDPQPVYGSQISVPVQNRPSSQTASTARRCTPGSEIARVGRTGDGVIAISVAGTTRIGEVDHGCGPGEVGVRFWCRDARPAPDC